MRILDLMPSRAVPSGMSIEQMPGAVDLMRGLFGIGTYAGVTVSQQKAESLTAFWRGANIISTAVGTLPIVVYEQDASGRKHKVFNDRERLVWDKPNPEVSRSVFWMDAVLRAAVTGDSFSRVVTVADDSVQPRRRRPIELWPIETHRVAVGRAPDGRKVYLIDGKFDDPKMDFAQGGSIFHVQGPSTNGLRGESPVFKFSRTLGLGIAEEIYESSLLGNGTQMSGYLSTEQQITPAQAAELAREWDERHKGAENTNRTAVMGRGTKWNTTQLNAVDSALFEARTFSIAEVGRIHGIPLWMLGSHDKDSSWGSGLEEQFRAFIVLTLQGWISRFQEAISDELLVQRNHRAEFDTTPLTKGKLADQVNSVKGLVQVGYDPAEVLEFVGLPPITHSGRVPVGGAAAPAEGEPDGNGG